MTTAAMVLGVIPLVTATGAGAVSRFQMGVVIASGLSIGTLFTLFVVPAVYLVLAADQSRPVGEAVILPFDFVFYFLISMVNCGVVSAVDLLLFLCVILFYCLEWACFFSLFVSIIFGVQSGFARRRRRMIRNRTERSRLDLM